MKQILSGDAREANTRSGMGIVYLVQEAFSGRRLALKTFQERYLLSEHGRGAFRHEGWAWVRLDRHPNVVPAEKVWEFAGRPYIFLAYVSPDEFQRNTLAHFLVGEPISTEQLLHWAIQVCFGMVHAYEGGITCHRDIKPENIMISPDGKAMVTDFGLAVARETEQLAPSRGTTHPEPHPSTVGLGDKRVCGTPGYIAPEVLAGHGADVRSDVYSFGVVLCEMATGSRLPLTLALDPERMESVIRALREGVGHSITRCLDIDPNRRYRTFADLCGDLQTLLVAAGCSRVLAPQRLAPTAHELFERAFSLYNLGRADEGRPLLEKALGIRPQNAPDWHDRAIGFINLGEPEQALACFDKCIQIDPLFPIAWKNKGEELIKLGHYSEALPCYDRAVELAPEFADAWSDRGLCFGALGHHAKALECYERALLISPLSSTAWLNKGKTLGDMGNPSEALRCFEEALNIDPKSVVAWDNRGATLSDLGRYPEAVMSHEKAVALDPSWADGWYNMGNALRRLGRHREAIWAYERAIELNRSDTASWFNMGNAFLDLRELQRALSCYEEALKLNPADAAAASNRAVVLGLLGSDV